MKYAFVGVSCVGDIFSWFAMSSWLIMLISFYIASGLIGFWFPYVAIVFTLALLILKIQGISGLVYRIA